VSNPHIEAGWRRDKRYRSLVRRIANWDVPEDPTTGLISPTYVEENIEGFLVESGSTESSHPVAVIVRLDAKYVGFDGLAESDQLIDPESDKIYAVVGEPVERVDSETGGFGGREADLKWLPTAGEAVAGAGPGGEAAAGSGIALGVGGSGNDYDIVSLTILAGLTQATVSHSLGSVPRHVALGPISDDGGRSWQWSATVDSVTIYIDSSLAWTFTASLGVFK
jgi:hypothetical protein